MDSIEKAHVETVEKASIKSSASVHRSAVSLFTDEEERKLVRKLDGGSDELNIFASALVVQMLATLNNIGLSIFYITYALSEVPSNLFLKHFGADKWIPILVTAFGVVCFATTFIRNFAGFMVVRTFLGLCEGGMMPGVAYYLSTYYKRHELVLRIGIFVSASSLSGAFGGLLASALLKIPQLKGV
ncbi:hypothetical protein FRC07_009250, partial [Ceratobasidium sp. 392]